MEVSDDKDKERGQKQKEVQREPKNSSTLFAERETKKAVETAFAMADTTETGKLTKDQLKVVLEGLINSGHDAAFISDKKMLDNDDALRMFIEVADRDGDKLINLNELLIMMDLGDEKLEHQQEHERIRRQRMEQQRREHRDMHDRVRRNQERQRDREAREHEEMHEFIRREIARMELIENIDSDDDDLVQAVVEGAGETEEYVVVVAGGEREDMVEEVTRDNSFKETVSQIVLEIASNE